MIKKLKFLILFCPFFCFGFQQININQQHLDSLENLYNNGKYDEVLNGLKMDVFSSSKDASDSLLITKTFYLKANSLYGLGKYKASILSYNDAIRFSPNIDEGKNLKGMALFDRAFSEYNIQEYLVSYNSVKSAESILSKLKKPNLDYLISIYADISGSATDYGYFDEAEYYLKKGLALYKTHKKRIITGKNQASKDILLLFKSVVLYAAQGKEKAMISSLHQIEKQKTLRKFNATENLMYVVGATKASHLEEVRQIVPDSFLLVPGVGAQGGNLQEVCKYGITKNVGLLVNSSRGILYASQGGDFAEVAANKARNIQQEMEIELGKL